MIIYASEFSEIAQALRNNSAVKGRMLALISANKISGKVTEGGDRLMKLRRPLFLLTDDQFSIDEAIREVEHQLPRNTSIHSGNNQVFPNNWAERLVRTQFSRFYNQAVLEDQIAKGKSECYVPPSSQENAISQCSQTLAGRYHDISHLLKLLIASYEDGKWDKTPKIPDHPYCTHVVKPIS